VGFLDKIKSAVTGALAGAGGNYYQQNFGLDSDEQVQSGGMAYFVPDVSAGAHLAAAAATLAAGAVVKVVGEQVTYVLTSKGWLVLGMQGGHRSPPQAFGPARRPAIEATGAFGDSTMTGPSGQQERTPILMVKPDDAPSFRLTVVESLAPALIGWSKGA
jgi:hypothetical protein